MPNFVVDTGLNEYPLVNKKGEVVYTMQFNPTDPAFIEKVFSAFNDLDAKTESYREAVKHEEDGEKVFEIARQMDTLMRSIVDDALGKDLCASAYVGVSMYAYSNGLPLWANLLLYVIDEMDDAFAREKKASNPRIKEYTEKFKRAG